MSVPYVFGGRVSVYQLDADGDVLNDEPIMADGRINWSQWVGYWRAKYDDRPLRDAFTHRLEVKISHIDAEAAAIFIGCSVLEASLMLDSHIHRGEN